eukprot:1005735-Alexandrium_andersonii.AAC.1
MKFDEAVGAAQADHACAAQGEVVHDVAVHLVHDARCRAAKAAERPECPVEGPRSLRAVSHDWRAPKLQVEPHGLEL